MYRRCSKVFLVLGQALPNGHLVFSEGVETAGYSEISLDQPACVPLSTKKALANERLHRIACPATHSKYQACRLSSSLYRYRIGGDRANAPLERPQQGR